MQGPFKVLGFFSNVHNYFRKTSEYVDKTKYIKKNSFMKLVEHREKRVRTVTQHLGRKKRKEQEQEQEKKNVRRLNGPITKLCLALNRVGRGERGENIFRGDNFMYLPPFFLFLNGMQTFIKRG